MINAIPSVRHTIPCVRHGIAGAHDGRLAELLEVAQRGIDSDLALHLGALNTYHGQLWATWKNDSSRSRFSSSLDQAWASMGESGLCVHLVPSDDSYDYQEDVMNNADRT